MQCLALWVVVSPYRNHMVLSLGLILLRGKKKNVCRIVQWHSQYAEMSWLLLSKKHQNATFLLRKGIIW
jgi:hypothetical protein